MKSKHRLMVLSTVVVLAILLPFKNVAADKIRPGTNNGKKWRIGYYEGGPYIDYQAELIALVKGLTELGWMKKITFSKLPNNEDTRVIWKLLSNAENRYIQFVSDAYWSADWNDKLREKNKKDALNHLKSRQVDLIIAMGTWGGKDLASDSHAVPTVVISTSDPIRSEIIKSAKDSGYDHVFARCDPERYIRHIRTFHNIFDFKRLGIIYDDSPDGIIWASLTEAEKVAKERSFKVIKCVANDSNVSLKEAIEDVSRCIEILAPKVDAFYITAHRGLNPNLMPHILKPFLEHKVPTWNQESPGGVKKGALLSIARIDLNALGLFQAKAIAKILNGAKPRDLKQIFEDPKKFAINLETANIIGYEVPWAIKQAADEIYEKIE